MKKSILRLIGIVMIMAVALSACAKAVEEPTAEVPAVVEPAIEEPAAVNCKAQTSAEAVGTYQVPAIIEGCYNVAFVYVVHMTMVAGLRHMMSVVSMWRKTWKASTLPMLRMWLKAPTLNK